MGSRIFEGRLRQPDGVTLRELARAWLELPTVWLVLRVLPARRLLATPLAGAAEGTLRCEDRVTAAREAARLVHAAARLSPFPSTCLTRSIVLSRLLRRRGLAAEIRIGVRRGDGPFAAHAWVEVDGEPVNDGADVADRHAVLRPSSS